MFKRRQKKNAKKQKKNKLKIYPQYKRLSEKCKERENIGKQDGLGCFYNFYSRILNIFT